MFTLKLSLKYMKLSVTNWLLYLRGKCKVYTHFLSHLYIDQLREIRSVVFVLPCFSSFMLSLLKENSFKIIYCTCKLILKFRKNEHFVFKELCFHFRPSHLLYTMPTVKLVTYYSGLLIVKAIFSKLLDLVR